jgi:tetratricopeptide (TPR) repeat protein
LSYAARGHAYFDFKNYQKVIDDYTLAIFLDSQNPLFYGMRGNAYFFGLDNYPKAISDYTQAIILDPKSPKYHIVRSGAYAALGNLPAAQIDARRACDLGACDQLEELSKAMAGE